MADENQSVNLDKWCFAWFAEPPAETPEARAGLMLEARWDRTDVIRIAFLDGTAEQIALVKRFVPEWFSEITLGHRWLNEPSNSHVRVTFRFPGSWSVIGVKCKNIAQDRPTMNFGWLTPGVADTEARRVILHEFGHALGLVHEHQRMDPSGWNKPAVIADLSGPPNNWDAATIGHNMFDTYPENEILGTKLDTTSIMMYPVPRSWRTDKLSSGLNAGLSALDRTLIRKAYS